MIPQHRQLTFTVRNTVDVEKLLKILRKAKIHVRPETKAGFFCSYCGEILDTAQMKIEVPSGFEKTTATVYRYNFEHCGKLFTLEFKNKVM